LVKKLIAVVVIFKLAKFIIAKLRYASLFGCTGERSLFTIWLNSKRSFHPTFCTVSRIHFDRIKPLIQEIACAPALIQEILIPKQERA